MIRPTVEPAIAFPVISRVLCSSGETKEKGGSTTSSEREGGIRRVGDEAERVVAVETEKVRV